MTILSPSNVVTQPKILVRPEDPNTRTTSLKEAINRVSRSIETTTKELEGLTSWLLHQGEVKLENRCKSIRMGKTLVGRQDNSHPMVLRNHRTSSQSRWDVPPWAPHDKRIQEPQSYGEDCCEPYYPQNCHSQSHLGQSYQNSPGSRGWPQWARPKEERQGWPS